MTKPKVDSGGADLSDDNDIVDETAGKLRHLNIGA
jgi:hypothetical protein